MNQNNNIIKICFVAPKAYPLFNPDIKAIFGGAEVDLFLIATELAKDKTFQVSCITADYGQPLVETRHNVKIKKSLNFNRNIFSQTINLWKTLNSDDSQIIFQEAASLGTFLVALFCRLKNKTFIYRTASREECNGNYFKNHPCFTPFLKWAFRHANAVITQNREDAQNLNHFVDTTHKVVRNAHPIADLPTENRRTILWVGRSAPVKKPESFLKLARELPLEHFTMICPKATGDDDYDLLLQKAREVPNCTFVKQIPYHKIHEYFRSAKILVNTSDSEGFPNTFIQAANQAVPILSLNVNPDQFLDQYQCGKCAEGNWDSFIRDLQFLIQPENMIAYGSNGRKYVEQHHDITKIIEQYKTIFRNISSSKET